MIFKYLKIFLLVIYFCVILMILKRIYINDINRSAISGSDKYMVTLKKNRYCCGHFDLIDEDMDEVWQKTVNNVRNYIKDNDDIYLYYDIESGKYQKNFSLTLEDFCKETDREFNDYINDESFHKNMGFFIVYNKKKKFNEAVINHLVYDLVKAYHLINLIYYRPLGDLYYRAVDYKYFPVFNELLTIIMLIRTAKFSLLNKNRELRRFKIKKK